MGSWLEAVKKLCNVYVYSQILGRVDFKWNRVFYSETIMDFYKHNQTESLF